VEFIRPSYPVHFQPKEGPSDFQWVDELPVTQRSFDQSGSVKKYIGEKGGETTRIAKVPEYASGRDTIAPDETAASHEL
jgi:hypothetical protein